MEDQTIKARDKAFTKIPTKKWKVRHKKGYPEAHNHIYLGEVILENAAYVVMHCRTFHFDKQIDEHGNKRVITGMLRVRRIPWSQIEVIHDLDSNFNYINATMTVDKEGTVVLRDEKNQLDCIITKRTDRLK